MVEANMFKEILPRFFYKNMVVVYQINDSENRSTKQYYEIGLFEDKTLLLVYPKDSKDFLKNPIIKGKRQVLDSKTNKKIFVWREGEKLAVPLGESEVFSGEIIDTQYDEKILNFGWNLRETLDPMEKIKSDTKTLFWIVVIMLVLVAVNILLDYMIAGKVGVQLFSGG